MKPVILLSALLILMLNSCIQSDADMNPENINSQQEMNSYLLNGWNPWNNENLLSYVLMPEGLSLQLTFRQGPNAEKPPFYLDRVLSGTKTEGENPHVILLEHAYDGTYSEMILEWKNTKARLQTATHGENLYILYTPLKLPENPPLMILETGMMYNMEGEIEKHPGFIQVDLGTNSFGVSSTASDLYLPLPIATPYISVRADTISAFYTGRKRDFDYIHRFVNNRKQQLRETRTPYGDLAEPFESMQSALAWNLICDVGNLRPVITTSRLQNEKKGKLQLSMPDFFTAAQAGIDHKYHAFSMALATAEDLASDTGHAEMPPVGSIVTQILYEKYPEKWFLEEIFDDLFIYNTAWARKHDHKGWFLSSSPKISDLAYPQGKNQQNSQYASVELLSLYIADCNLLAGFATILGKTKESEVLKQMSENYSRKLMELWDTREGIYKDKNIYSGVFSASAQPTSLVSLLTRVPGKDQAEKMIENYYLNEDVWNGNLPLSSNTKPGEAENCRLCLPHLNFLIYFGFENYGLEDASLELAAHSLDLFTTNRKEGYIPSAIYRLDCDTLNTDSHSAIELSPAGGLLTLIALIEYGYWDKDLAFEKYY